MVRLLEKYEKILPVNNILVAGIELIKNNSGDIYTYDVNTNTNYNSDADAKTGVYGMLELAKCLGSELNILK